MEKTAHDSRYSWTRLALSLGLSVVGSVGMWSVIVVLPEMQAELGLNRADATLPYVAMTIGFATGNLTLGRAIEVQSRTVDRVFGVLLIALAVRVVLPMS